MKKLNFYQRAAKLGHPAEGLRTGVTAVLEVASVDALRELLDNGLSEAEREAREEELFGNVPRNTPGEAGLLRRVQGYLYGNTPLSADDRERIKQAFPVKVFTESAEDPVLSGPNDWGTSVGLVIKNYGTVTMNDQAYVTIQNSPLQLTMDNLIRKGTPPAGWGDFNIRGATGPAVGASPAGSTGGDGGTGTNGDCSSVGIAGKSGSNGKPGSTGSTGPTGTAGNDGLASMNAEITVTTKISGASSIFISTRSGTGGVGGAGGKGGNGGKGGTGGNGATCECTGSGAGNGGDGGRGGDGGPGGPGGNGTNAAGSIRVKVPTGQVGMIVANKFTAPVGDGGAGGAPGAGGGGGAAGKGGKHNGDGSSGATGGSGSTGSVGPRGTQVGTPAEVLPGPF